MLNANRRDFCRFISYVLYILLLIHTYIFYLCFNCADKSKRMRSGPSRFLSGAVPLFRSACAYTVGQGSFYWATLCRALFNAQTKCVYLLNFKCRHFPMMAFKQCNFIFGLPNGILFQWRGE